MGNEIKFIFFDMGKVLLNFDHERMVQQVASLAGKSEGETRQLLFEQPHDLENRFERGELNEEEFFQSFCDLTNCSVEKADLMLAVADIFWLNVPIVNLLAQLKAINFPIAILSNTCSAHWDIARREYTVIRDFFEQRILSYEENSMKPDSKIYKSAIALAKELVGCEATEIFFTDDRQENVDAAREAGMQAELYVSTRQLARQLAAGGVPITP